MEIEGLFVGGKRGEQPRSSAIIWVAHSSLSRAGPRTRKNGHLWLTAKGQRCLLNQESDFRPSIWAGRGRPGPTRMLPQRERGSTMTAARKAKQACGDHANAVFFAVAR